MEKSPEAFKGTTAPHFPNYFFAVGPNGLPLDAPCFLTAETNVETIARLPITAKTFDNSGRVQNFSAAPCDPWVWTEPEGWSLPESTQ
jgi:hypothetical protein